MHRKGPCSAHIKALWNTFKQMPISCSNAVFFCISDQTGLGTVTAHPYHVDVQSGRMMFLSGLQALFCFEKKIPNFQSNITRGMQQHHKSKQVRETNGQQQKNHTLKYIQIQYTQSSIQDDNKDQDSARRTTQTYSLFIKVDWNKSLCKKKKKWLFSPILA